MSGATMVDRPDGRAAPASLDLQAEGLRLVGLQALCAISMTSCDEGVCSGLRTGETGGSWPPSRLSWSSWCELVAVQMSASSSGSSKNPGVASGGGWPSLGLWGRRPGLGGDIIIFWAGFRRVFPPLFLGRRYAARGAPEVLGGLGWPRAAVSARARRPRTRAAAIWARGRQL